MSLLELLFECWTRVNRPLPLQATWPPSGRQERDIHFTIIKLFSKRAREPTRIHQENRTKQVRNKRARVGWPLIH